MLFRSAATALETHVYASTIGPIPANSKVTYMVGAGTRGYTPQYTIKMVPGPTDPIRFIGYSDIGVDSTGPDGQKKPGATTFPAFEIRELGLKQDPQLVLISGDLAYNNAREGGWDAFMRFMEPVQSKIPTMPVIGNHEWDPTLGYAQFHNEYVLPNNEHDFVFKAGPITFIGLNSDRVCGNSGRSQYGSPPHPCDDGKDGKPNQESLDFIRKAAADAQTDDTAWTIAYFHHPPFSHGRHGNDWGVQALWVPLFEELGVDLVLTAHDHLYSRSFPILDLKPVVIGTNEYEKGNGVVYVVSGGGGRGLYDITKDAPPPWHAKGEKVHHLYKIEADNSTLKYTAIRVDGSELDSFTIASKPMPAPDSDPGVLPVDAFVPLLAALVAVFLVRRR